MPRPPASVTDPQSAQKAARLGSLLGTARRSVGLSQQRLAEQAGVSIGSVAKLEGGRNPEPGFFLVARVVSALSHAMSAPKRSALQADVHAFFQQ